MNCSHHQIGYAASLPRLDAADERACCTANSLCSSLVAANPWARTGRAHLCGHLYARQHAQHHRAPGAVPQLQRLPRGVVHDLPRHVGSAGVQGWSIHHNTTHAGLNMHSTAPAACSQGKRCTRVRSTSSLPPPAAATDSPSPTASPPPPGRASQLALLRSSSVRRAGRCPP